MTLTRRDFTLATGATLATAVASGSRSAARAAIDATGSRQDPHAWHQRIKRIVQVNFNEKDPQSFDAEKYADHLAACHTQATWLSVTNITAFYPTSVPGVPRSPFLGDRDIFGECVRALRTRGIRILGRLSPDLAKASLATDNPEWFRRDSAGKLVTGATHGTGPLEFALTCQFSTYYSEVISALMAEVMSRYGIDGIYTNGWPNGGGGSRVPQCFCVTCRNIGNPSSDAYRAAYVQRAKSLWQLFDRTVTAVSPQAIYTGNLGGGLEAGDFDLGEVLESAPFYLADAQGRYSPDDPAWTASQQVRLGKALVGNRPVPLATATYALASGGVWRNASGNPAEVRSRLFQTAAAGGTLYAHWLGFQQGFVEDRRWQALTRELFAWQAENDEHFHNIASLADVALVVSLSSNRTYRPPAGTGKLDSVQGMYRALVDARVPFDLVLDSDLSWDRIGRYKAIILPNVASMGASQARWIADYVARGGSLLSTFETGLYDESGAERPDFALAALHGIRKTGKAASDLNGLFAYPPGMSTLQRIEQPEHPLAASFGETDWIAGPALRVPIAAETAPILSFVPAYPTYPTEAVYPRIRRTSEPTVVAREVGRSRLVYFSGEMEGTYWRSGSADIGDLLVNAIRWICRNECSLTVEGHGLVEIYGWKTEPGYAVHLINYTNPEFRGGAMRKSYSVGAQRIRMVLADATPVRRAKLLRASTALQFQQSGRTVEFAVADLQDYEVAVLET